MQTEIETKSFTDEQQNQVVVRLRNIATEYFRDHPEARDGVMKSYHAYHVDHFRCDPSAHNFPSAMRESKCVWCGRSREMVRFDDLHPECAKRPVFQKTDEIILGEERRALALLCRAEQDVSRIVAKLGMSGKTLALLHHTYGYDPETVAGVVDVSQTIIDDYHHLMEVERSRSRASMVREIITATTSQQKVNGI